MQNQVSLFKNHQKKFPEFSFREQKLEFKRIRFTEIGKVSPSAVAARIPARRGAGLPSPA